MKHTLETTLVLFGLTKYSIISTFQTSKYQSIILFAHKIQMFFTRQYKSWTNKAIKLLQLPKKYTIK